MIKRINFEFILHLMKATSDFINVGLFLVGVLEKAATIWQESKRDEQNTNAREEGLANFGKRNKKFK